MLDRIFGEILDRHIFWFIISVSFKQYDSFSLFSLIIVLNYQLNVDSWLYLNELVWWEWYVWYGNARGGNEFFCCRKNRYGNDSFRLLVIYNMHIFILSNLYVFMSIRFYFMSFEFFSEDLVGILLGFSTYSNARMKKTLKYV